MNFCIECVFVFLNATNNMQKLLTKKWAYNIYFWLRFIYVNQKSLKRTFKTSFFFYKITFWICVLLVLWIQKGYFVVKKLVRNVCNKAFWYTQIFQVLAFLTQSLMWLYYPSSHEKKDHLFEKGWAFLKEP